jgi:hypothetical protein
VRRSYFMSWTGLMLLSAKLSSFTISSLPLRHFLDYSSSLQSFLSRLFYYNRKMQSNYFSVARLAAKSHTLRQAPDQLPNLHSSTPASRFFSTTPPSNIANSKHANNNQSITSSNLLKEVRASLPAVRYTVYAGLGLIAIIESTFWFNVLRANFFPSKSEEGEKKARVLLERVRGAVDGVKAAWMGNYGRYYGRYVWGVGER